MSVRAYITELKKDTIKERNGEKKRIMEYEQNINPLFNIWHDNRVFDILTCYGRDFTNQDCVGFIEILSEEWDQYKEDCRRDKELLPKTKFEEEIFIEIDSYFKKNSLLTLNCY